MKNFASLLGAQNVKSRISLEASGVALTRAGFRSREILPARESKYWFAGQASHPAHPLLAHVSIHRSPPGHRVVLTQARVYGPTPAVVDRAGNLVEEISRDWGKEGIQLGILRSLSLPSLEPLRGNSFLSASLGAETYFHWMTDVLPMLLAEQRRPGGVGAFDFFLVPHRIQAFHRETFRLLGIPESKIILIAKGRGWACEQLTCHSSHHVSGRVPQKTMQEVARLFRPQAPVSPAGKRLAVLRSAEFSRALPERDKILHQLASFGYEEYEPAKDSIQEQARVFGSARSIVAAHGAALTNLIFCRPGTTVVELFSSRYVNPCYAHICRQLGLRHVPLLDRAVADGIEHSLSNAAVPIQVTAEEVRAVLRKASK